MRDLTALSKQQLAPSGDARQAALRKHAGHVPNGTLAPGPNRLGHVFLESHVDVGPFVDQTVHPWQVGVHHCQNSGQSIAGKGQQGGRRQRYRSLAPLRKGQQDPVQTGHPGEGLLVIGRPQCADQGHSRQALGYLSGTGGRIGSARILPAYYGQRRFGMVHRVDLNGLLAAFYRVLATLDDIARQIFG